MVARVKETWVAYQQFHFRSTIGISQ